MIQARSRRAAALLSQLQTLKPPSRAHSQAVVTTMHDTTDAFADAGRGRRGRRGTLRVLAFGILAVLAVPAGSASAATFTAACSGTTGDPASLVAAITSANAAGGSNTVQLSAGCTYTLTAVNNNWYGPDGLPAIASEMTIEGNGATIARFASAPRFRFFFVGADIANGNTSNYVSPGPGRLTLTDVTLSGGLAKGGDSDEGGGGAGMGGAIFSQGTVIIDASTLTGNTAQGGASGNPGVGAGGGGIGTDADAGGSFDSLGGGFGAGSFGGGTRWRRHQLGRRRRWRRVRHHGERQLGYQRRRRRRRPTEWHGWLMAAPVATPLPERAATAAAAAEARRRPW